jgi:hypothetical protein
MRWCFLQADDNDDGGGDDGAQAKRSERKSAVSLPRRGLVLRLLLEPTAMASHPRPIKLINIRDSLLLYYAAVFLSD